MRKLLCLFMLYGAVFITTSEIVTQKHVSFDIFRSSFTIVRREERHPIEPYEASATYQYYKDIYVVDISDDSIMLLKTITPSNYTPASSTDEVIEWDE